MKIIIAGAGKVGYSGAQMLESEGHDLTVIERDAEAELLIAATEMDEVNMICGIAAKKLGTPHAACAA